MNNKNIKLKFLNAALVLYLLVIAYTAYLVHQYWTVDYEDLLKSAAVLAKAEALPENEGRLVIIKGTPRITKIVIDKEYHQKLDTPSATRDIEKYITNQDTGGKEWKVESSVKLFGGAKLGNFVLDDSVLDDMPQKGKYTYNIYHDKRAVYHYAELPAALTVIGMQKGRTLIRDYRIKLGCVFKGRCSVQQMIEQSEDNHKHYRVASVVFFLLGVLVGLLHWSRLREKILNNNNGGSI